MVLKSAHYREAVIIAHPLARPVKVFFDPDYGMLMCEMIEPSSYPAGTVPTFEDDDEHAP